ncbi:MAG: CHAP domain-containing protein [Bacilli bacterium]|nr:CHAP domain-containing protein [Bacilli bacterium]
MDRTIINYNLVAQSSKNLENTVTEVRSTSGINGELRNMITQIISEGRGHDDCLAPYEGELGTVVDDVGKSIQRMEGLSKFCMEVFDAFLVAEQSIIDGAGKIKIDETIIPITQIESSGMKEYVNSALDPNDLAGSINPNNLTGPLSEEEWKRYELMFTKAMNESTSKKEKAAIAAIFLTSVYPHMPYDWGGGHYEYDYYSEESINKTLGETYNGMSCDFQEKERLRTYDCSGFTSWVLKEAGYPKEMWSYENDNKRYPTSVDGIVANSHNKQQFGKDYDSNSCSVGDIAYMHNEEKVGDFNDDHIGVVVAKEGDVITVAHVSAGSGNHKQVESAGFGYTKINVKTGEVIDDSTCKKNDRMGKVYFTHTASVNEAQG